MAIDATKPVDGVPAVKADLRNNLQAVKDVPAVVFAETAAALSGKANQYLKVNAGATAIESVAQAAGGDASTTSYTAPGTGAVTRTVQGRLRDAISVKDFGATGDGTTDDQLAIQAAFDYALTKTTSAALGVTVYFPHGVYKISSTLFVGCYNVIGDGRGARIEALAGFGPATISRTYDSTEYTFPTPMLLIDGAASSGNALTEVSNLFIDGNNIAPIGVLSTRASHASLRNLRVFETTLDGVVIDAIQNSTFINLWVVDNGRHNYRVINGVGWCSFVHCFARFSNATGLTMAEDATYPGAGYGGKAPKNLDVVWLGGLIEGEQTAGQRTHCVKLTSVDRAYFLKTQFYSPANTAFVECLSGATGPVFEDCSWQTGTVPAVKTAGPRTALIRPSFWNWSGATNVVECSQVDGLYVERPYFNNVTSSGKYVAYTGADANDKVRSITYIPVRQGGSNGQRPTTEMQKVDAVAQFWTRDSSKPLWWDPIAGNWKDATGAIVA